MLRLSTGNLCRLSSLPLKSLLSSLGGLGLRQSSSSECNKNRMIFGFVLVLAFPFLSHAQTIWLFSDSLGWQAKEVFQATVEHNGYKSGYVGFPGTAICDWLSQTFTVSKGDLVVMQFSGNNFTPCMKDPKTGKGFVGNALLNKYAEDSVQATKNLLSRGVTGVVWQGSPITAWVSFISEHL